MSAYPPLDPNIDDIRHFLTVYCETATPDSIITIRAFLHSAGPPLFVKGFRADDPDLVDLVYELAVRAANHSVPTVLCICMATFNNPRTARGVDIVDAIAISSDFDECGEGGSETLVNILGPASFDIASGGMSLDPDANVMEDKRHLHWMLLPAARTPEELADARECRHLMAVITGADRTNVPLPHPIRLVGTVHNKGVPRLSKVLRASGTKVNLQTALTALRKAAPPIVVAAYAGERAAEANEKLQGDPVDVEAALLVIPNTAPIGSHTEDSWSRIAFSMLRRAPERTGGKRSTPGRRNLQNMTQSTPTSAGTESSGHPLIASASARWCVPRERLSRAGRSRR